MAYTKPDAIPCEPGETVVLLDSGQYVAAQCPTGRSQSNTVIFAPTARWIDAAGVTQADSAGRAVVTAMTHSASADQVDRLGASAVVRECLYLVLGEPLTVDTDYPDTNLLRFGADNIAQCSIRNAIASAQAVAPNASEVL